MRSSIICKLKTCSMHFNPVLYHGTVVNRETYLISKLYYNARCLSSKNTFQKTNAVDKTQNKDSENQRGYRDRYGKENGQKERNWIDTSLQRSSTKSVFAAGTAKKTAEILRKKAALVSGMRPATLDDPKPKTIAERDKLPDRPLSVAEWRKLKESMINVQRFEIYTMNGLFNTGADLDIAKSLLTFVVTETGTLSYELLLRYLTLCVMGGHDSEVFDVYDIMRTSFPSLETGASSLFIKSFCRTERWRKALVILQELKKVVTPSPRNYGDIISAAVQHSDFTTTWMLYDELIEKGLSPHAETWEVLFSGANGTNAKEEEEKIRPPLKQRLLGILHHMRENQIYPPKNLAKSIKTWFESLEDQKWEGRWTTTSPKGMCHCCGTELESIQLTEEEYKQLKDKVMVNVIQGQDVFNKTTPQELERFKAFVKRKPAFDVVVDGLNVANINKDKSKLSETLLAVVSELVLQGQTVLVLGRKHMLRPTRSWDRNNMNSLQQKAHCFFTENISEDDPFLLYAALHSGNHCRFVSRDLMRDHKACLPDGATKRLFFKWQRGHQLVVDGYIAPGRKVCFQYCHILLLGTVA
ncbi:mitochondrial ribonuclease P catalytic subunit isoform X2 [Boleophthalmus pectinirostris]|uniref:mitochondrial ribonuclease P catalytic subunit isoform X2 n=1 Tax=Boleophthalmus pectinirostris TaxID=150288 RepID=UPI00242D675B|nr:mitochondrial ribonuclease P catalytic subunit isoform X2 [Boleophthalmus pectinirostris]